MSQLFIEDYFKHNLDSIKNFHMKVNNKTEIKNNREVYTIYFEENEYYAIKNNDQSTSKHLTMFNIADILNMKIDPNVNKTELENFILSFY